MSKFYFTYNNTTQPIHGGYCVINADGEVQAIDVFRAYHQTVDSFRVYTEEKFKKAFPDGKYQGSGCQEEIAPLASSVSALADMICELKDASSAEVGRATLRVKGALDFALMIGCISRVEYVKLNAYVDKLLTGFKRRAVGVCS